MSKKDVKDPEEQEVMDTQQDNPNEEVHETDPVDKLESEISSLKDQHLRLYADFENYKKRISKERLELFTTAKQEMMDALLPILDDFQRALKNLEGTDAHSGIQLIFSKLDNTLKNKGLQPMDNTTGAPFDVDTMEAVTRIPAPSEDLKGKVVDEIERGYKLGNKILRYAKVVVG
ncbi:MAG TPA: nucleotide exchange factor GrpE, partial [Cryomorphaceae bacterium]|nr:nucleotide exchange factor GrpE [Cryomorphaceae bacterium]